MTITLKHIIERISSFIEFVEAFLLATWDSFGLGIRFAAPYYFMAWLLIDAALPVNGMRFTNIWLETQSLPAFLSRLDDLHLGNEWLFRADTLAIATLIFVGLPAGERVRRSWVYGPKIFPHAGLLTNRVLLAISPIAITICSSAIITALTK